MANRIWQGHFGTGPVATPSDFGRSGTPPSHPELLDWLASEFIRHGWSIKHIHRLITLAYQLAFNRSPTAEELPEAQPLIQHHGLPTLCCALFNANEFLFLP